MRVVVGYASAHGSTREIAAGVAERLTRAGIGVDLVSMDELDAIVSYDAASDTSWVENAKSRRESRASDRRSNPGITGTSLVSSNAHTGAWEDVSF